MSIGFLGLCLDINFNFQGIALCMCWSCSSVLAHVAITIFSVIMSWTWEADCGSKDWMGMVWKGRQLSMVVTNGRGPCGSDQCLSSPFLSSKFLSYLQSPFNLESTLPSTSKPQFHSKTYCSPISPFLLTLTLKKATAMYAETLEQLQRMTLLNSDIWSCVS